MKGCLQTEVTTFLSFLKENKPNSREQYMSGRQPRTLDKNLSCAKPAWQCRSTRTPLKFVYDYGRTPCWISAYQMDVFVWQISLKSQRLGTSRYLLLSPYNSFLDQAIKNYSSIL